jgi:hypothetical protein
MPALASNAPLSSISTVLGWTIGAPALVEEQRSASGLRLSLSQRLVAVGRGERVFHAAGGGREL